MRNEKISTVTVLGSTGSIGRQTMEVVRGLGLRVCGISGGKNVALLEQQIRAFSPAVCAVADEAAARDLRVRVQDLSTRVEAGAQAIEALAAKPHADLVYNSILGTAGLRPTLAAVESGHDVALSNKETLVAAGQIVMRRAAEKGVRILPVDSEHCAIWQCLAANAEKDVKRLILTCSGGPYFGCSLQQLQSVTKEQTLSHPTWNMGAKITVDCATLMNKGLELIEAMHLFSMLPEKISIVIHRESIIHSMVEYIDHAVLAQMGVPDMRLCIQYAATAPRRLPGLCKELDFAGGLSLSFCSPDETAFPALPLARKAAQSGGILPCVLSAANEIAVAAFLEGKIAFSSIVPLVASVVEDTVNLKNPTLSDIFAADRDARTLAMERIGRFSRRA